MMTVSDDDMLIIVGKNIQECRTRAGWSQTQLANESGLDRADISRYENGTREMKIKSLVRITTALAIPMDTLFIGCHLQDENELLMKHISRLNRSGYKVATKMMAVLAQTPELTDDGEEIAKKFEIVE